MDFSWVPKLMARLPKRREDEIHAKKDGKWLPYDILAGISGGFVRMLPGIDHSPKERRRR